MATTTFTRMLTDEVLSGLQSLEEQGDLVRNIVTTLALEIIEGSIPAGVELTSVELGKRFNTSRTPVREALAILSREGLVEIRPRVRPRVSYISPKEVQDLYQVRATLYSLVSREIVRRVSDEDLVKLAAPLELMRIAAEEGNVDTYFGQSVRFRHQEVELAGNPLVGNVIDSLGLRVLRVRRRGLTLPGRLTRSYQDHKALYDAYVERDETLAKAVTESLVLRALKALEANDFQGI
jgi:DNA-binding GntR family transcriptional regulator